MFAPTISTYTHTHPPPQATPTPTQPHADTPTPTHTKEKTFDAHSRRRSPCRTHLRAEIFSVVSGNLFAGLLASSAEKAMGFHSPLHSSAPHSDDVLRCPSSTAQAFSPPRENKDYFHAFPCSPKRDPFDPVLMDRMRCKQELHKLYEDTLESCYDLSLKDIVDPSYSISGNLKAIVAEADAQDIGRSPSRKGSSIPKLTFSFSFPGLRGRSKRTRANLLAGNSHDGKDTEASTSQRYPSTKLSPSKRSNSEADAPSMSRIHPYNQCSMCASYTIFFKCHCLVCGRLYCSNCAREHMDNLADGFKCKEPCKNGFLSKRLSLKIGSTCWPFGKGFDVRRLQYYD